LALLAGVLASGCVRFTGGSGTFERAFPVSGPVRLEVQNGSGDIRITTGAAGAVKVRGDFQVRQFLFESAARRVRDVESDPPVEQSGSVIRVGYPREKARNLRVDYTIVVPADTELRAASGSGDIEIQGARGPAALTTGSGNISAADVGGEVEARTGSGNVTLGKIAGRVRAGTGSGNISIQSAREEIRASTGSGNITVEDGRARLQATTGSGRIQVTGAAADLRASTGSGNIRVEGNPPPQSYWELKTGSGDVTLDVPPTASFRLYARSNSRIETDILLTVEDKTRRELRGRVGAGEASVTVQTSSGSIHIR
jgi:DUF4097 and DUF4098 domain-containing protein YvlB